MYPMYTRGVIEETSNFHVISYAPGGVLGGGTIEIIITKPSYMWQP